MSTTPNTPTDDVQIAETTIDTDDATLQTLVEEVYELKQTVAEQDDRIDELEAENERLQEENEELRNDFESMRGAVDGFGKQLKSVKKLLVGEGHADDTEVMNEIREQQGPINAQLAEANQTPEKVRDDIKREVGLLRAEHGSQIRALAEQTDADLDVGSGGDKISRVRDEGVDAVVGGRIWAKHRRAEIVLKNIEEWGTKASLRAGKAYRLTRPRVRRMLNARDNLDLQSRQIEPIIEAIEELADGTTRFTKRRIEDGVDALYLGWPNTEG